MRAAFRNKVFRFRVPAEEEPPKSCSLQECRKTLLWPTGVLEQALGLLVTLLLRNPAAAERAAGAGCVDTVLEAMQAAESDAGFPDSPMGAQWVQRQVCALAMCTSWLWTSS